GVLGPGGRVDRRRLGALAFRDAAARRRLERATHPAILREMRRRLRRARGVVVVDAPLLFEKGLQGEFDATVLVGCPAAVRARRVARRDGLPAAEVRRRMSAQWPDARKRALADYALFNDSTRNALRAGVRRLHAGLSLLCGGTPNGNAD
ncbi:MAG: dephospho-CoA kinase, partial [Elusimicrobia bacterium]|nr:dephospho-CoA kinase [Elusimicrobiota bacterium]